MLSVETRLVYVLKKSQTYRIMEWLRLEGTFKDHLIPTPLPWAELTKTP